MPKKRVGRLDHEAVHLYFELTYANYLVIPRSILQSMPDGWQKKFVQLVEECEQRTNWRNELGDVDRYSVKPVTIEYTGKYEEGREIEIEHEIFDKFMDYDRGRTKWPLRPKERKS